MKKWLIVFLFLVKVKVPFGVDVTYRHVKEVSLGAAGTTWNLVLEDGRKAVVPVMWAVIEDEKEDHE